MLSLEERQARLRVRNRRRRALKDKQRKQAHEALRPAVEARLAAVLADWGLPPASPRSTASTGRAFSPTTGCGGAWPRMRRRIGPWRPEDQRSPRISSSLCE